MNESFDPAERRWDIRAARPQDLDGIRALYQVCFHKTLSPEHWHWKLHTLSSPAENEWVAEAEETIVGYYAVTPVRFKVKQRTFVIPHGCDRMTNPLYRRQGIYGALGVRANTIWQPTGAPFQFAFIPGRLGKVLRQLGWQAMVRMVWLQWLLRPSVMMRRRMGFAALPGVSTADSILNSIQERRVVSRQTDVVVHSIQSAGDEFDRLWERIAPSYPVLAVRDRAWVQWRYLDLPGAEQYVLLAERDRQPCGYLAYRVHRAQHAVWAVIMDCFAAPRDDATIRHLLVKARREMWACGVESVVALTIQNSPLYQHLRRVGFRQRPHHFEFSIIPYGRETATITAHDWFLTGAEGDVV